MTTENRTEMLLNLARQSLDRLSRASASAEGIETEAQACSLALTIGQAKRYAAIDDIEIPIQLLELAKAAFDKLPAWNAHMVGRMADLMGDIYAAEDGEGCEEALIALDNMFMVCWAMVGAGKAKEGDILMLAGAALKAVQGIESEELAEAACEMWLDLGPMDRNELTLWLEELANRSDTMKRLNAELDEGFKTLARQRKGVEIMFQGLSEARERSEAAEGASTVGK